MDLISRHVFLLMLTVEASGDSVKSLDTFTPSETPRGVSPPQVGNLGEQGSKGIPEVQLEGDKAAL